MPTAQAASLGKPVLGVRCANGSRFDLNFAAASYCGAPLSSLFSISRAAPPITYAPNADGSLSAFAPNTLRIGIGTGLLPEEARTNNALWSRDMTNAAWTKTTMTVALNATGVDGSANSATTLTATGANATALQTITLGSAADAYSVYLKRVTGTGTINVCMATTGCGTVAPCTTNTSTFTRCPITGTLANPIVGIQIVTNGDAVIADFNQLETGAGPTSPIPTTTVAVARSADALTAAGPLAVALSGAQGTARYVATTSAVIAADAYFQGGGSNDTLSVGFFFGNGFKPGLVTQGNANIAVAASLWSANTPQKMIASWQQSKYAMSSNGATVVLSNNAAILRTSTTPPWIGNRATAWFNNPISRITVWNYGLSSATLQALSQ